MVFFVQEQQRYNCIKEVAYIFVKSKIVPGCYPKEIRVLG